MFLAHHFSNDKNVDKHTLFYEKLSHTARQKILTNTKKYAASKMVTHGTLNMSRKRPSHTPHLAYKSCTKSSHTELPRDPV